ncbi:MAG: DUF58 domain-containing protein [Pseudomonadota bacterium]
MIARLKQLIRSKQQRWIRNRLPEEASIHLTQRRIFIFPTRQGFAYLFVVLILFLMAINYQNSLVFGLCFWLIAVFVVCVHHTFLNVHGLLIDCQSIEPGFEGGVVALNLKVRGSGKRVHHGLELLCDDGVLDGVSQEAWLPVLEFQQTIKVSCNATQRGYMDVGRVRIRSVFPLGLLQGWSWLRFGKKALVYPKPEVVSNMTWFDVVGESSVAHSALGEGEFHGLREFRVGDSLRRVDWKRRARGLPLMLKLFDSEQSDQRYVDWGSLPGVPKEQRLSQLCYLALQWHRQGKAYGLRLPHTEIMVSSGKTHLTLVLTELALFT